MSRSSPLYRRHRFPGEIISHRVWLFYRFSLSYRDIEELMDQRGVRVTYETIRQWCLKFGQMIGRRTASPSAHSRNKEAAIIFLRRLLKGMQYAPRVSITDKLKSYGGPLMSLRWRSTTANTRASITGQRIRINPPGSGSASCGASSRRSKPNASWHRSV